MSLTVDNTDRTLSSIVAGTYAFPTRLPVRLFPAPTGSVTLTALVKKKVIALTEDSDEPELRNVESALAAFGLSNMLRRARQFGRARDIWQEAAGLLSQLKQLHTWQEQTHVRLEPEVDVISGQAGDDLSGKGFW